MVAVVAEYVNADTLRKIATRIGVRALSAEIGWGAPGSVPCGGPSPLPRRHRLITMPQWRRPVLRRLSRRQKN